MNHDPVMAIDSWRTNADLIASVARLGYLRDEWSTLDCTHGLGVFWRKWRPANLVACDADPGKSPIGHAVDFTAMPFPDRSFDVVVFDPPYKLNGTPDEITDHRYGVHTPTRWQDRMDLCKRGIDECCRVADHTLLVKCQDQVCSGRVRWQSIEFAERAKAHGFGLVDRFDLISYRPQPAGRTQLTARRNSSQLLVLRRNWTS